MEIAEYFTLRETPSKGSPVGLLAVGEDVVAREKSCPDPLSVTVCGLSLASSSEREPLPLWWQQSGIQLPMHSAKHPEDVVVRIGAKLREDGLYMAATIEE